MLRTVNYNNNKKRALACSSLSTGELSGARLVEGARGYRRDDAATMRWSVHAFARATALQRQPDAGRHIGSTLEQP